MIKQISELLLTAGAVGFVLFFLFAVIQEVPWYVPMKNTFMILTPNRVELFLTNSLFFIMTREKLIPWREPAARENWISTVRETRAVHNLQPWSAF